MRSPRRQLQPYTRPWQAGRPSLTTALVSLCVAAGCAQAVYTLLDRGELMPQSPLNDWLGIQGSTVARHEYWQFLTYLLLHAGPFHLLGNVLLLFFAGREVEPILGPRHFLGIFTLGSVIGGVVQWAAIAAGWAPFDSLVVGASSGVMAMIAAYATILPELQVNVYLFFVLPLRTRAKYLGLGATGLAVILAATQAASAIGPLGMVAASAFGWLYVKQLGYGNPLAIQRYLFERRQRAARLDRMPAEQFISEEIDPILEKIAREGMHSLSRTERKILARGKEKIEARKA